MNAKDFMNQDVLTLNEDATVRQMFLMMEKYNVESFVVLDDFGEFSGIISGKEMLNAIYSRLAGVGKEKPSWEAVNHRIAEILELPVREIMIKDISGAFPQTSAHEAGFEMFINHIDTMPVMEEKKVVGIVTPAAVFFALVKEKSLTLSTEEVQEQEAREIRTSAAIWRKKNRPGGVATKRAYPRAQARLKVAYWPVQSPEGVDKTGEIEIAYSKDLSAGGLMLEIEKRIPPGTLLYVKFQLDPSAPSIESLSSVCWTKEGSKGIYYTGIAFMALTTGEKAAIARYVGSIIADA